MKPPKISFFDFQELRFERRKQLVRGWFTQLRGVSAGKRFGIGTGVRILFPAFLEAGDDVMICDYSYLDCLSEHGVKIGNHTILDRGTYLSCGGKPNDYTHGFVSIGDYSYIGVNSLLGAGGGITIGKHVLIGSQVVIHAENHCFRDKKFFIFEQGVSYKGVVINDDVWIGSHVSILDGAVIGEGSIIGAGSVVRGVIPPYSIAVGVPVKVIGERK